MGKLMLNNINYTGGSGGTNVVPNPPETATDDLTSIKIDNTVYNLAGGDVADVEVNGESVLDANHVARIKSYKTLTQAEYDALPSSKLTDDVLYCITDAGIVEEQQFAPVIYSLEERQIGTWIDGKPLYAKTIELSNLVSGNNTVSHGIVNLEMTVENISFLIDSNGYTNQLPAISTVNGWSARVRDFGLTTFVIELGSEIAQYYTDAKITMFYTKTTDIPGSGDWTTSGVPTVHYDENEKIIGTWFGETLFERTFNGLATNTNGEIWVNIGGIDATTWKDVVNVEIYCNSSDVNNKLTRIALGEARVFNGNVQVTTSVAYNREINVATIQYTKVSS